MAVDIKYLSRFFSKLEWEGGYEQLIEYGIDHSTGDGKMDQLLEKLEAALGACKRREKELFDEYGDQLGNDEDDI